eukprot:Gregarina_sp_Poly_1__5259@NODE_2789_length_1715_cov_71_920510_g1756_i0_p3_GENE_NODE_2789_length_1715_cov_71_920510_g1756_i0NODE_2789_length_1715_cov_71_920510_g1756_i0_p3_ORF_typecomplete_len102_score5_36Peroxin22/PF12827_7/0_00057_NODE_2789_length_1715_cov_71_920510_g1756_i011371442
MASPRSCCIDDGGILQRVLLAQVASDNQAAKVLSLLESSGLVADNIVPRHRILFCDTYTGRSSIVRQISPTLHFESNFERQTSSNRCAYRFGRHCGGVGES